MYVDLFEISKISAKICKQFQMTFVDGNKLINFYDKDLTEGLNLFIGKVQLVVLWYM